MVSKKNGPLFLYLDFNARTMKKYFYAASMVIVCLFNTTGSIAQWNPDKNSNNPVVVAANRQELHGVCTDNAGGAIIAWNDSRNNPATYDVYIKRLNAAGNPLWPANGIPMGILTSTINNIAMTPVAGAGAIIAFMGDQPET